jgi:hypothetical protein
MENSHHGSSRKEKEDTDDADEDGKIIVDSEPPNRWTIFKQLQPLSFSAFYVFVVTLSLFPAILTLIKSVNDEIAPEKHDNFTAVQAEASHGINFSSSELFTPLTFLMFSLGDWFGKSMPGLYGIPLPPFIWRIFGCGPFEPTEIDIDATEGGRKWRSWRFGMISSARWIFVLTVLRTLFIPFFFACNIVLHDSLGAPLPRAT